MTDREGRTDEPVAAQPREEPATDRDDPSLYDFDGMLPQCGYVVHFAHCRLDAGHDGLHSPGRLPAAAHATGRPDPDRAFLLDCAGHLAKYGCDVYHPDEPCRWQRAATEGPRTEPLDADWPERLSDLLDEHRPASFTRTFPIIRCRCGWEGQDWPPHFYGACLSRLSPPAATQEGE